MSRHPAQPKGTSKSLLVSLIAIAAVTLLLLEPNVLQVEARTRSTSPTLSSDMTLTETPTESILNSRSFSATPSSEPSLTAVTFTAFNSVSESATKTPSGSSQHSATPKTQTRTASPDLSFTITVSNDASGFSNTTLLTTSSTITVSDDDSASTSKTLTGDATQSGGGIRTLTLTQTMTMTESVTMTLTKSLSPSEFTPSLTKDKTPSATATRSRITHVITEDASWSDSQSNSRTFSPDGPTESKSVSVSDSVLVTATDTGTATLRKTTTRTQRITPTNTESATGVETNTLVSVSGSRTLGTFTQEMSLSARSVSMSLTNTLLKKPVKHRGITLTMTMSITLSDLRRRSVSPSAAVSKTETISEYLSPTASSTFTGISASEEVTKTLTLLDSITTTGTVSQSQTTSRSEATVSDMRTRSVTKSQTVGSWEFSATTTDTVTNSKELTPSAKTYTYTLTLSPRQDSHTRHRTPTYSVSETYGTLTIVESSTFTLTDDITESIRTKTLSKMTSERTSTLTQSADLTHATRSVSASQGEGSRSLTASGSPTPENTRGSFSLSVSKSIQTATGRLTATRVRRGLDANGKHISGSHSLSQQMSTTITDSATIMSHTRSIPHFVSLGNSLAASIGAVLFPSLEDSTAPCMSLALYVIFPLFIILVVQLLLCLISKSLRWKVDCDTHRNVPIWRSLLITTSYVGFFVPCHLRCAYAHTLRLMVQVLVLLLLLECLVDQLNPVANNVAAFCAALAIVISQVTKPITHAAYCTFRFPKDDELSAQMHLAQMKRIVRLRRKENLAAKRAERERRRQEGLDDVSTTTEEEPEFAFDPEGAVSFDYLDGSGRRGPHAGESFENPSLNDLHFGRGMDLDFPDEKDVFAGFDYQLPPALAEDGTDVLHHQTTGPGYVDVSFPGEEGLKIVDFYEDNRVSTAEAKRRASFVKDVNGVSGRASPPPGLLRKKQSWVDPDQMSIDMMSLGTLASYSSPTRAAIAVADGRIGSSSSLKKPKPKKKRIGPGRDGVVVIPDFDDDFGVKELPNSDDEEGDEHWGTTTTSTTKHQRSAVKQLTTVSLFSELDPEDLLSDDDDELMNNGFAGTVAVDTQSLRSKRVGAANGMTPASGALVVGRRSSSRNYDEDDDDDKISVTSSVRYRTEVHPIVTPHLKCSILLIIVIGVLLFAIDRYRHLCVTSFNGDFGNLWAISLLVDATVGDALVAAIVYLYRRLTASGEEGNHVASFLHPFDGELRARMYEHLSDRFSGKEYLDSAKRASRLSIDDS